MGFRLGFQFGFGVGSAQNNSGSVYNYKFPNFGFGSVRFGSVWLGSVTAILARLTVPALIGTEPKHL